MMATSVDLGIGFIKGILALQKGEVIGNISLGIMHSL